MGEKCDTPEPGKKEKKKEVIENGVSLLSRVNRAIEDYRSLIESCLKSGNYDEDRLNRASANVALLLEKAEKRFNVSSMRDTWYELDVFCSEMRREGYF